LGRDRIFLITSCLLPNAHSGAGIKGEVKNDGKSHDLYENKGRANGQIGKSHNADENKRFIS
jgi:hypothetical protein